MADIVLPATTFLEHDDIYIAGGHTFLQVARKVIEPYGRGALQPRRHLRTGAAPRRRASRLRHDARGRSSTRRSRASGLPDAATIYAQARPRHGAALRRRRISSTASAIADRRFHFRADWARDRARACARCRRCPIMSRRSRRPRAEHPFRMIAPPARSFLNTSFNNTPSGSRARAGRRAHPSRRPRGARARRRRAACGSATRAAAWCSTRKRSTACSAACWWSRASGPTHAFEEGIGINALTSADPGLPNGGAVYHDTAVWARPA